MRTQLQKYAGCLLRLFTILLLSCPCSAMFWWYVVVSAVGKLPNFVQMAAFQQHFRTLQYCQVMYKHKVQCLTIDNFPYLNL